VTKGALVELMPAFGVSTPNVVAFQFNPETLRHSWTQPQPKAPGSNPLAVPGMPGEAFSFALAMDATDQLALGVEDPRRLEAHTFGIYSRLAALELLMFPADPPGGLSGIGAQAGERRAVPASQLRTVLFVWGAGRIVPVRLTSLVITEKLFDASLNPTHAEAQIELRVLTPTEIESIGGAFKVFAAGFYQQSHTMRQLRAIVNFHSAAGSITLPHLSGR
jgi:hypothetical protein